MNKKTETQRPQRIRSGGLSERDTTDGDGETERIAEQKLDEKVGDDDEWLADEFNVLGGREWTANGQTIQPDAVADEIKAEIISPCART